MTTDNRTNDPTEKVTPALVTINYQKDGKTYLLSIPSEHAEWAEEMLSLDLAEVERAVAEKALLGFKDRLLSELEATEKAGIELGDDYLHGMRSCLSQVTYEAKVHAYRREETE